MESTAWIMDFRGGHQAAVGELELMHVLPDSPELFPVIGGPRHCQRVFLWEDQVLPVFDLSQWLGEEHPAGGKSHFAVFRYREGPGQALGYGAMIVEGAPRPVAVSDEHECTLPPSPGSWRDVAISCFDHGGRPVPILDLPRIFADSLSRVASVPAP